MKHRLAGKKSLKKQWMQKESVSKQGRKPAKAEPIVHKDPTFDELADDTMDYMETEDAQDVGRTSYVVHEEEESAEKVSTEDALSTAQPKVSTDKEKVSTDKEKVSTDKEKVRRSATQIAPTIFGDDETITQVLIIMSQNKEKLKEKEKGSNRDKGRDTAGTLMAVLLILDRDDICAIYQLVMNRYQDETPEGFDKILWGDLIIMFNQSGNDEFWNAQQNWKIVSWKLHSSSGIHTIMTDEGIVIHMLVENKYPLKKEVLSQLLKLKLETEEDSTMALELIRFVKKQIAELDLETLWEMRKVFECCF
ncbi:hypothetical protein Tco_1386613 [Tanacetum coccineum]